MNKQTKPDSELCREANVDRNYLAMAKFHNIDKYNYIKKVGINQYKEEQDNLIVKITSMQIELVSAKLGTAFYKQFLTDYFSTTNSFLNQCSSIAFRFREGEMRYVSFTQWTTITNLYNKHKEQLFAQYNKKLSDYQ